MDFQAKVIQTYPAQSGTSKAGKAWRSQDVITETLGNYPKKVKLKFFGDKAIEKASRLVNGQVYNFAIDLESRLFQDRWYTDVTCYNVTDGIADTTPPQQQYPQQPQTYTPQAPYGQPQTYGIAPQSSPQQPGLFPPQDSESDLPF